MLRAALVLVALSVGLSDAAPTDDKITDPHRGLTPNERALLRPLFRDSLDYDKVQVIRGKFFLQPDRVYMTPRGNIYAPGDLWSDDFAAPTTSAYRRAVFVHEITHVWQFENGMDLIAQGVAEFTKNGGAYERAYPYTLAKGKDLVDYGMEQQASIVEDYFLIAAHEVPQRMENRGLGTAARSELYAAVLGNFLGNATYARKLSPADVEKRHEQLADTAKGKPTSCDPETAKEKHFCSWRFEQAPKKP
jgi:hypothetical protein